jgi:hypothetical protein
MVRDGRWLVHWLGGWYEYVREGLNEDECKGVWQPMWMYGTGVRRRCTAVRRSVVGLSVEF